MKQRVITGLAVLMGASVFAETYYLQGDMTTAKDRNAPLITELWFSQRSGGGEHPAKITGNSFAVNGKKWRTPNSGKTSKFPGTFLVDEAGADTGELMTDEWKPAVMQMERPALMRLRRSAVTLSPGVLKIIGKGAAEFRAHSDGSTTLMLEPGKLEGDGRLVFGKYNATDTKGVWSLSCADTSGFSGAVVLDYGMLTVEDPLNLSGAAFSINAQNGAVLVVDDVALTVKSMSVDGKAVAAGTYSAKDLAKEIGQTCVKGSGEIIILQ
jgi:hypothetical protein